MNDGALPPAPCDGATFCDGFDDLPELAKWRREGEGGVVALSSEASTSPPSALSFAAAPPGASLGVSLVHALDVIGGAKVVRCAFDVQVPAAVSGQFGSFYLALVGPGAPYAAYAVSLGYLGERTLLWEYGLSADGGEIAPARQCDLSVTDGRWHHAELVLDYRAGPRSAAVTIDGAQCAIALVQTDPPPRILLTLGGGMGGGFLDQVRFDTLTCDVR